jgi:hypothetical protein
MSKSKTISANIENPDDWGPPILSNTQPHFGETNAVKLSRTDILKEALTNAKPKKVTGVSHLKILSEPEWRLFQDTRKNNPKTGLQQLFASMKQAYEDNNEPFFKDYTQFYNTYRNAVKLLGL